MKILLITVRSDFGGGPRHVDQLINNLLQNIEIYVAYPQDGTPYGQEWNSNSRIKSRINIPFRKFSTKTLFEIAKFIKENSINIVHSHGNGAGVYSRLLPLLGVDSKIVHTFHGISEFYSCKAKKIIDKLSGVVLKYFTDAFVLVSYGELELGQNRRILFKNKSQVIYNGIEDPHRLAERKEDKVVTISRFNYQKNMDSSFAIASAFKQDNSIRFVWVGDGDDYSRLKQQAEKECINIEFVGFSINPMEHLCNSSIYLSTSRFEGLPYALIEAAAIGLPIIASDVKGNNEVVMHGFNGYLFHTIEEGIGYIEKLHKDRVLSERMSRFSRTFYEDNFTINKMIDALVSVYDKLNFL